MPLCCSYACLACLLLGRKRLLGQKVGIAARSERFAFSMRGDIIQNLQHALRIAEALKDCLSLIR